MAQLRRWVNAGAAALVLLLCSGVQAREPLPLGHPDFYPTPERPLGWRGDGTGAWPGADVVADWDAEAMRNVAWKVDTPGAGLCQPIVAGEKVFVTADPNLLCCYNVHTGELLWKTAIDHTLCMSEEERAKARAEQAFFDGKWREYCEWRRTLGTIEDRFAKAAGVEPPADRSDRRAVKEWERARQAAVRRLYVPLRQCKRLVREGDEPYAALIQTIGPDADLKALYERALAEQDANRWRVLTACNGHLCCLNLRGRGDEAPAPFAERYREAQENYDIWFPAADNWLGYTTYSFATPATDGRYVYVMTANNAVAAVDFGGAVKWLVWEHRGNDNGVLHTRCVPSPRLMDGKLVVNQNGEFRVYDAETGRKIWGYVDPYKVFVGRTPAQQTMRPAPEAVSPVVGRLPLPEGGSMAVVMDGNHLMWRLEDGHLLSKDLPKRQKGSTPILVGDLYAWVTGGDRKPEFCGGVARLKAVSRDEVRWEHLWRSQNQLSHQTTPIVYGGGFYAELGHRKGSFFHDLESGERHMLFKPGFWKSNCSPIVAGRRMYSFRDGDRGPTGLVACAVGDLETGDWKAVAAGAVDRRGYGDDEFALLNRYAGCGYQQNSSPAAQANRLFFRARGVLWSIGDAAQPFPVPKDCPPHARVGK